MKKNLLIFGLIAATAVVFSCSKEPVQVEPAVTPAEETEEPTPVTPAVDGNLLTSFGVTFEGDTKVTVDLSDGETEIEENDKVLVFVDADNKAIYKYNGTNFVLDDGETAVTLSSAASVFYPADKFEKATGKFVMPGGIEATGDFDFGAINPMAGVIEDGETPGTYSVELCNVASVLRVKVTADVNINSVTLDYGSMVYYATGSKYFVDASAKTMTYSFDASDYTYETVELGTPALTADVLFIVPTVGLANGLTVTANLAAPHNGGANTFTVENTSTTARLRNKISTMNFYAGLFSGGTGVDGDHPYLIANARDFKNLQKYTVEGYTPGSKDAANFLNAYYRQTADIDLKNAPLTPIGNSTNTSEQFTGNYDGNNKKLQNVNINVDTQFAAPFGYVRGSAVIKNLTVTGNITKTGTTQNYSLAGGIAGILNGNAQVTGCTNEATISSSATFTGGIAGRLYSSTASISNCHNKGSVSGVAYVGGIVGDLNGGKISSCENRENVTASSKEAGGIAGRIQGGTIRACYSSSAALIQGTHHVGGIAGYQSNQGTGSSLIINCASKSNTRSTGFTNHGATGGLVGYMYADNTKGSTATLTNSVALGSGVCNTSGSDAYLGAIIGYMNSNGSDNSFLLVRNCYSQHNGTSNVNNSVYYSSTADGNTFSKVGKAGSDGGTYMGGMYGYLKVGTVQNCYCVVGDNSKNGAGINQAYATVGAGSKETSASASNTRMVINDVKNGTATVNISSWTFAGNSIKPQEMSITNQYLVDVMNFGTWSSKSMSDRYAYTSSEGTSESVCVWEGLNGTAPTSYDPAYPKELKDLGANYRP